MCLVFPILGVSRRGRSKLGFEPDPRPHNTDGEGFFEVLERGGEDTSADAPTQGQTAIRSAVLR